MACPPSGGRPRRRASGPLQRRRREALASGHPRDEGAAGSEQAGVFSEARARAPPRGHPRDEASRRSQMAGVPACGPRPAVGRATRPRWWAARHLPPRSRLRPFGASAGQAGQKEGHEASGRARWSWRQSRFGRRLAASSRPRPRPTGGRHARRLAADRSAEPKTEPIPNLPFSAREWYKLSFSVRVTLVVVRASWNAEGRV